MEKIKCPVCGFEMPEKSLIFHIKKRATFEVYDAYTKGQKVLLDFAHHEAYIQANSTTERVFKI